MTIAELAFAIATADAFAAVLKGRMNKPWLICGFVFGLVLLAGTTYAWVAYRSKPWRPDSVVSSWPHAGMAYVLTLLGATAALVFAANRLWRQRDLHDLIRL